MNRREFIKVVPGATAASLFSLHAVACDKRKAPASADEPNIVLFVADDLGWKDLGCYGNADISTPNIDRLAAQGIRFTNAFVVASSCSPSRASLITGQYPHTNGVVGLTHVRKRLMLSPFKMTVAELLREHNYVTAIEGKWHVAPYFPTGWYGYEKRLSGMMPEDFWIRSSDKAVRFVEENRGRRFYLELNYMDTHRDDYGEFHFVDEFPVDPESITAPEYYALPDWPEIRLEVAKYYSNAAKMDMMIGRVLDKLDEAGLAENTLVCFVSDNGSPFPGNKMTLYDRGIGVPLILRWPGKIPAGGVNDSLVSSVDIMPTLLDAARCYIPRDVQGKSLVLHAQGKSRAPLRDAVFAEMTYHVNYLPMRAARTTRWKYIRNYSDNAIGLDQCAHMEWAQKLCELPNQPWTRPRVPEELFDLEADPHEQRNLVGDTRFTKELNDMRSLLDQHMRETRDPYLGRELEKNYREKDFTWPPGKRYG